MEAIAMLFAGGFFIFTLILLALIIAHYFLMATTLNRYVKEWELDNIFSVFAWIPGLQFIPLGYILALGLADKHNLEMSKAVGVTALVLILGMGLIAIPFGGIITVAATVYLYNCMYRYILPSEDKVLLYTVLSALIFVIALPLCMRKALDLSQEG